VTRTIFTFHYFFWCKRWNRDFTRMGSDLKIL